MRASAWLILLVLLVPLALALTIERPGYAVGDEWTYAIVVVDAGAKVEEGDRHVVVLSRGPVQHNGQPRDAVTVGRWENATAGGETFSSFSTSAYDAATGAFLFTRSGGFDTVAAEPCIETEFPLSYPQSWTSTCKINDVTIETFYQVAGGERLTVPAGTYDTLSVDRIGDPTGRLWYANEACGRPVAEFYQVNERATYANLTAVKCAKPGGATTTTTTPPTGTTVGTTTRVTTTTMAPTSATPAAGNDSMPFPKLDDNDAWTYESEIVSGGKTYYVRSNLSAEGSYAASFNAASTRIVRLDFVYETPERKGATVAEYESFLELSGSGEVYQEGQYVREKQLPGLPMPRLIFTYDAPCRQVKWPLVPGESWTVSCKGTMQLGDPPSNVTFDLTGSGRVEAKRASTVPKGTFETFPVVMDLKYGTFLSRAQTLAFARDACWYVDANPGLITTRDQLTHFLCTASAQGDLDRSEPTPGLGVAALVGAAAVVAVTLRRRMRG